MVFTSFHRNQLRHALIRVASFCVPNPADRMRTPVEPAIINQNVPAVNTVLSQPVTLLAQGSPRIFRIQSRRPVLQKRQTVFAVVHSSNKIQQAAVTQPVVSMPNEPIGQFNSVNSLHSAGRSVSTNPPTLPKSY